MRLLYATSITFPSPLANRVQVLQMAKAFNAVLGKDFLLGIGKNKNHELIGSEYVEMGTNAESYRSYRLSWRYIQYALKNNFTHIYCREEKLLFFMILFSRLSHHARSLVFCYEMHELTYQKKVWYRYILKYVASIVSITVGMKNVLVERGVGENKIIVAPDAVSVDAFNVSLSKEEARRILGLPEDRTIVMYTGSLDPWKGVDTLYKAATMFDDKTLFVIVGGRKSHVDEFVGWYPPRDNVIMVGYKEHKEIPLYLCAADIVVLPNSGKQEISRVSTSPMKLFEYMAAKRPIIASDLPSIREIGSFGGVDKVIYFKADDPSDLAEKIVAIQGNSGGSVHIIEGAYEYVKHMSWNARAHNILDHIS